MRPPQQLPISNVNVKMWRVFMPGVRNRFMSPICRRQTLKSGRDNLMPGSIATIQMPLFFPTRPVSRFVLCSLSIRNALSVPQLKP